MKKLIFAQIFFSVLWIVPLSAVIKGKSLSLSQVQKEAGTIDSILLKSHRDKKIELPKTLDESILARRIYLAISGRIPSYDEINSFVSDQSDQKKEYLIEELLHSPGYKSQMFNWWADLLRLQSRMRGGNQIGAGELYNHWVKEQINKNTGFNQIAYSLVTAEGYPWEDGASGYYLRDAGMELDNMSNTTQLFLGTQMVCAQCHNHPFDKWTQLEYYNMAAFTYGISTRMGGDLQNKVRNHFAQANKHLSIKKKKKKAQSKESAALRKALQEMMQPLRYGSQRTNRKLSLPHDYQYTDAKPKDAVSPRPIFGKQIEGLNIENRVEVYGKWLTSPDNPRFTRVIANRMWKKVFGRGLVEPVDDWRDDTQASIPELLEHLEKLMVRVNFDLREFQRILFNVKAFEREATNYEIANNEPYFFESPVLSRMSAEQLWDSFVSLSIPYSDERIRDPRIIEEKLKRFTEYQDRLEGLEPKTMVKLAGKAAQASKQVLKKMDDIQKELREAQEADDRHAVSRLRREYSIARNEQRTLFAELIMGSDFDVRTLYGRSTSNKLANDPRWKGYNSALMRASEITNPAPPGHFLREFGQSDREIIENSNTQATVPQALTLLNGVIYGGVFSPNSPLSKNLSLLKSDSEKIRVLFLSLLSREPTERETMDCLKIVKAKSSIPPPTFKVSSNWPSDKKKKYLKKIAEQKRALALSDNRRLWGVAWAIMNTRQFSFIQ